MRRNLASWDRVVRFVLLVVLVPAGVVVGGIVGIVLAAIGLVMGATGSAGYCPIEDVTGLESKPQQSSEARRSA